MSMKTRLSLHLALTLTKYFFSKNLSHLNALSQRKGTACCVNICPRNGVSHFLPSSRYTQQNVGVWHDCKGSWGSHRYGQNSKSFSWGEQDLSQYLNEFPLHNYFKKHTLGSHLTGQLVNNKLESVLILNDLSQERGTNEITSCIPTGPIAHIPNTHIEKQEPHIVISSTNEIGVQNQQETANEKITHTTKNLKFLELSPISTDETSITEVNITETVGQEKHDTQLPLQSANINDTSGEHFNQYNVRHTKAVRQRGIYYHGSNI